MEKLRAWILKHYDILAYLFFGGLTTIVNFVVYWLLYNLAGLLAVASTVIAWAVSVLFAYVTNKPFVFRSHDWSLPVVLPEFGKFVGCRVGSGLLETAVIFLTVDVMHLNGNVIKIVVSVFVVILNYVASKLVVFRKKR